MKGICLLFIISLFINDVFGDEGERVSVNYGGSVTLHTNHTDPRRVDVILWRFKGERFARISREVYDTLFYYDKRFTDRLKMNPQTGDLTITHITSELTGEYEAVIINGETKIKTFSVGLSPKVKKVISRDSVSLHIDVTDEQRKDKIHWRIKHNNSLVAEIITENGRGTKNETHNEFRDRVKLNEETGDVIITNMKKEDSGDYEADVTIRNTHTIHKTFTYTAPEASARCSNDDGKDDGSSTCLSSGQITGIIAAVAAAVAVAAISAVVIAAAVVVVICIVKRLQDKTETIAADVIFIKKRLQDLNGDTDKYTYGNRGITVDPNAQGLNVGKTDKYIYVDLNAEGLNDGETNENIYVDLNAQGLNVGETNENINDNETAPIEADPVYVPHLPGPENPASDDQNETV